MADSLSDGSRYPCGNTFVGEYWLSGRDVTSDSERQVLVEKADVAVTAVVKFDPSLAEPGVDVGVDGRLGLHAVHG